LTGPKKRVKSSLKLANVRPTVTIRQPLPFQCMHVIKLKRQHKHYDGHKLRQMFPNQ